MAESEASALLHDLMTEINGVKSQWEALVDRISQGYGDAYKLHTQALDTVRKTRKAVEDTNREMLLFMFSVMSVGFAGGAVGSLLAPWSKAVDKNIAEYAFREGVKGVATETAKKSTGKAVDKLFSMAWGGLGADPFDAAVPSPWDAYLDKKTRLDTCFGFVNEHLTALISMSNEEQWGKQTGQDILDSWRRNCPLLVDAPKSDSPPDRKAMADSALVLMWIAWASARDWKWWTDQYNYIEFLFATEETNFYERDPRIMDAIHAIQYAHELQPILDQVKILIGYKASIFIPEKWSKIFPQGYYTPEIIDLRILGKVVQWTSIIKDYAPAVIDVEKQFGKTNIPTVLSGSRPDVGLFGNVLSLKPFFKRPTARN